MKGKVEQSTKVDTIIKFDAYLFKTPAQPCKSTTFLRGKAENTF